ncbi:MAG: hypothetical protein ACETWC_06355 [Acidobacteriota bacterium]
MSKIIYPVCKKLHSYSLKGAELFYEEVPIEIPMAHAMKKPVVAKYDYPLMVSRLEKLYRQLIDRSDLRLLIAKRGTPPPG